MAGIVSAAGPLNLNDVSPKVSKVLGAPRASQYTTKV
jgi:hypothetical protein